MKPQAAAEFQVRFIASAADWTAIRNLFNQLPDVAFFVKDAEGRFVLQNKRCLELSRVLSEVEIVGKTDFDLFGRDRAEYFRMCDERILRTGSPMENVIEPAPDSTGRLIVCSKYPIAGKTGETIGIAGVYRFVEGFRDLPEWCGRFRDLVEYIRLNYAEELPLKTLAAMAGVSVSQLERRFAKLLNLSVGDYIQNLRLTAARELLETTDRTITDIGQSVGFYDHSHFSRIFRRWMGVAPDAYRRSHRSRR